MYSARAIATKVLYLFMAVIIATGGFLAAPSGPAQAASPFAKLTNPATRQPCPPATPMMWNSATAPPIWL